MKRGYNNVTAVVYMDCGKKSEREDDWRGLKGGPEERDWEERDECRDLVNKRKRHPGLESRRERWLERAGERGQGELESCKRGRTRFPVLNSCRERGQV